MRWGYFFHNLAVQNSLSNINETLLDIEDRRERERNGEPLYDPAVTYDVYPASELGLLRIANDPSASEDVREDALERLAWVGRGQASLDLIFDDLKEHLRVLPRTAYVYFKSPVLALLTLLMLAGQAAMLVFVLSVSSQGGFGSAFFDTLTASWGVYNVVALTFTAFSPLFLASLRRGVWRLVGGKPHGFLRVLALTSAIPALLCGSVLVFGQSAVNPIVPAVFVGHAVLPFVIRRLAADRIRRQIRKLSIRTEIMNEARQEESASTYLESLLKRKIIGTPGASLGTSEFDEGRVSAGVAGERRTAKLLDAFVQQHDNAIVFHSVRWNMDGAPYDIDHVVVMEDRVFFLDSKQWGAGHYTMLESGDTVLRDGKSIPNGNLHIQSGADTYITPFGLKNHKTQVVVWTEGTLSNQGFSGPRLVTGNEMIDWLKRSSIDADADSAGYNVPLLRTLEANAS